MEILLANESKIFDHPLYSADRTRIPTTEMNLQPGGKYLITDPLPFDFFLRCVYRVLRKGSAPVKAVVDGRHYLSEFRKNVLVHFKLLYPELEIIGDEINKYICEQTATIQRTGKMPAEVLEHWRTAVEYPTNLYEKVRADSIVVTGCSFTFGTGLDAPERERYDVLLGEHFGRPVVNLSYPGSSLEYAANTLRQAPLTEDNIVVWQLTGILRWITPDVEAYPETMPGVFFNVPIHDMVFFDDDQARQAAKRMHVKKNIKVLFDTVDYLRGIGCRLVLLDPDNFNVPLRMPERVRVETIDYGNDYTESNGVMLFSHPGPKTHQAYAQAVIAQLHNLYGIKQPQDFESLSVV